MTTSFRIDAETETDRVLLRLSGDLDLTTRPALTDQVLSQVTPTVAHLVLDMEAVTFCDSSGLGGLLDIRRATGDAGVELVLRNVPRPVARILDLTDVDGWLQRE